jgi:hypothetical protein
MVCICKRLVGCQAAIVGTPPGASSLPQGIGVRLSPFAPHHSTGRALARLQHLILIHPPLREAEWRCSSGKWRAAPFDAVEHAACRSSRSRPEGSVPGWIPERRNAEPKRGAGRLGRAFLGTFLAFGTCQGTCRLSTAAANPLRP